MRFLLQAPNTTTKYKPLLLPGLVISLVMTMYVTWLTTSPANASGDELNEAMATETVHLSGRVLDKAKEPVVSAEVEILVNGHAREPEASGHGSHGGLVAQPDGSYQATIKLTDDELRNGKIELKFHKASFKGETVEIKPNQFASRGNDHFADVTVNLERKAAWGFWIATIIFIFAYILIAFELLHRTLAAMLGAATILVISYTFGTFFPDFHILSYERAIHYIDMNVILLLMGMMIIVGILKHTGVFQWCAYKSYQIARGRVLVLSFVLMIFTAISSAFLDNVTTMLLLTPVTIEIALSLGISPLALLIPEILASNVGGTATLIGDPPNIMIGSYTGLTFGEFVVNLAPTCAVAMVLLLVFTKLVYGKRYQAAKVENIGEFLAELREKYKITDSTLLVVGGIIMGIVIAMFLTHGFWHMEVSIAALFGAAVLFTYGRLTKRINLLELVEKDIEWTTLLFFMFLFMLVGAVEEAGLLAIIADWVFNVSAGSLVVAICLVLWVSAFMSAFVDNIPFTATMMPIVAFLTKEIPGAESQVLWWALAFGACFGGNGTLIGASANVVTLGIAEAAGFKIKFFDFMKVGLTYMILSTALANIWLLMMY